MNERLLISKREASAALNISIRTLENLVSMRELTPRRIGRRVLFDVREVERFVRRDHRTQQERKGSEKAIQGPHAVPQQ